MPLDAMGWHDPIYQEGHEYRENQLPPLRRYRFVSPGAMKTTGTRVLAGRDFTWTDVYEKQPVAMLSANLARELWGTPENAIGKRLRESPKDPWHEVTGVIEDERDDGLDQKAASTVFWPILMDHFGGDSVFVWRSPFYMIRSQRTGTAGFMDEVRRAVWSVNSSLPLANVRSMQQVYDRSLARTSFTLAMLAIAGAMALLLGMVGIYGVIAYSVAQRRREIGIRMALGAQRRELTGLFLRHGLRMALIGVACGLAAAAGFAQLMAKLLFEVKPIDPLTYAAVAPCLIGAALAASYLPALRISAIDPVEALRSE
jgi:predicted permease